MNVRIITIPKNGPKTDVSLRGVMEQHAVEGTAFATDFYVDGAEAWHPITGGWRHPVAPIVNVDHHAPHRSMQRLVSSANLALDLIGSGDRPRPLDAVLVSHMDCDSVLAAGILSGRLAPDPGYGTAALAADHTGEENPVADLLQALDAHWSRKGRPMPDPDGLEYFFDCLDRLERGRTLDTFAAEALEARTRGREMATAIAAEASSERGVHFARLDTPMEGELLLPLMPNAWVVATANVHRDDARRWHMKLRLGRAAPPWLSLHDLGLNHFDPAYGGRWNAGSNNRSGGTELEPEAYRALLILALEARLLERAIEIAVEAHAGQRDKAGAPYILHPFRVMMACDSADARIVGVLHDVVEDSAWTFERLADEGFSTDVLAGLAAVTKRPEEKGSDDGYFAFCRRATGHPLGRVVKRSDLLDNLDVGRLGAEVTDGDLKRLERYRKALAIVEAVEAP